MAIEEGKTAENFELLGHDGLTHQLSDWLGQWVIVYFYPKDDTPGCTREACGFRDLSEHFSGLNAVVLGVSPDAQEDHIRFIKTFDLPFLLLSDPERKVMEAWGAWGKKIMYGKEKIGVIRSTVLIDPDGIVVRHWRKVPDAEAHPLKVFEELRKQSGASG